MPKQVSVSDYVGVLPYSKTKDGDVVVLVFKHRYTSTLVRANADHYTELIAKKLSEEETSQEAAARVLSLAANGLFATKSRNAKVKKTREELIERSRKEILSNLRKMTGTTMLENAQGFKLFMTPIKYVKSSKLGPNLQYKSYLQDCQWVSLAYLLKIIYLKDLKQYKMPNINDLVQLRQNAMSVENIVLYPLFVSFCFMLRNAHDLIDEVLNDIKLDYKSAPVNLSLFLNVPSNYSNCSNYKRSDSDESKAECKDDNALSTQSQSSGQEIDANGNKIEKKESESNETEYDYETLSFLLPQAKFNIFCKKCRKKLMSDLYLLEHSQKFLMSNEKVESSDNNNNNVIGVGVGKKCTCLFINSDNEYIYNEVLVKKKLCLDPKEMSGLLYCCNAKCKAKIGRYSYHGEQCGCGEWMYPSFQLSISKVDVTSIAQMKRFVNRKYTDSSHYFIAAPDRKASASASASASVDASASAINANESTRDQVEGSNAETDAVTTSSNVYTV